MTLQDIGTDFIPANPIELIGMYTGLSTIMSCFTKCNSNPNCRTFVSDNKWPYVCRLYQGSIDTGTISNSSLSSTSQVGGLRYDALLYGKYNQICDPKLPPVDRYLICNNQSWGCPTATYWDGFMCVNQVYYQASCNMNGMCRKDIDLICLLSRNTCVCRSTTIWNGTSCVLSTCPNELPQDLSLTALWPFDGDVRDLMNYYNGTMIGNSSFVTGYVRDAIKISNDDYIQSSYINFYLRSFTIELWFYLTNITSSGSPFFGECLSAISNECLHVGTDSNSYLYMGFWSDDVYGSTVINANQWYHAAFVYDYSQQERLIYLNGIPESVTILNPGASHLYFGQSGNTTIGRISIFDDPFFGYIDQVSVTDRAKTDSEILDDASLVAYYSFDCGSTFDSGPNLLHGFASGNTMVTGRINQAIEFNSSTGYFQASGFTALGMSNQPFSISLWVKPLNVNSTLIHLSTGNVSCTTVLSFSGSGNIIAQISNTTLYGPIIPLNVWTHIIHTFSFINGSRLYINGTLIVSSGGNLNRDGPNVPLFITIANTDGCIPGNISKVPYIGAIDELRIYNREISASEISSS